MKKLNLLLVVLTLISTSCTSTIKKPSISQREIQDLRQQKRVVLSEALRARLIADSQELKLTPEELQVLKSTGKVILCGKCGYILNSLKYKEYESNKLKPHTNTKTGFPSDSIRHRIIMTYTN